MIFLQIRQVFLIEVFKFKKFLTFFLLKKVYYKLFHPETQKIYKYKNKVLKKSRKYQLTENLPEKQHMKNFPDKTNQTCLRKR